jgi:hypothetical protein
MTPGRSALEVLDDYQSRFVSGDDEGRPDVESLAAQRVHATTRLINAVAIFFVVLSVVITALAIAFALQGLP